METTVVVAAVTAGVRVRMKAAAGMAAVTSEVTVTMKAAVRTAAVPAVAITMTKVMIRGGGRAASESAIKAAKLGWKGERIDGAKFDSDA